MEALRMTPARTALLLLLFCAPAGAQTAEEFIRKAQAAPDSNTREVIYTEAIKKHPTDARLHHKRGVAYGVMEYHDEALADFERAIALDPSVPSYYHDRGLALHRLKRNEEAVRDFTRLIELEPANARGYYLRAVSYTNLKQLDKAEPDLDRAVQLDPKMKDEASVRQMRGLIKSKKPLITVGGAPAAAPEPERKPEPGAQAAAPGPESPAPAGPPALDGARAKALANKAKVRGNLKKYEEAAGFWTELLELQPGYYPAYAERAYALHKAGDKAAAAADFEKAFAADPAQPRALLLRGAAACSDGDFGRAAADLEKALSLDPKIKRDIRYSFTHSSIQRKKNCK
ncbi:MAG TPA: hypothetical protein DCS63_06285 [Elusimicrobia bacterium]|nr:hypothetical protein [Elusimicrobiota bacterium]